MPTEYGEIRTSNRQTHAHHTLKRAVKALGSRAIDKRTGVGKALELWRNELIADLGGISECSTQQKALIDIMVREKLLLDSLDAWLLQQRSLVNVRKKSIIPALGQRAQLANSLASHLQMIGLARRSKPVNSLAAILAGSATTQQHEQEVNHAPIGTDVPS